jgi:hypothetical protein
MFLSGVELKVSFRIVSIFGDYKATARFVDQFHSPKGSAIEESPNVISVQVGIHDGVVVLTGTLLRSAFLSQRNSFQQLR